MSPSTQPDKYGSFLAFVLLEEPTFDLGRLAADLAAGWGLVIPAADLAREPGTLVTELNGLVVAVSLMDAPIPNGEAAEHARNNFRWPEAEQVADTHRAHLVVAVLRGDQAAPEPSEDGPHPLREAALLFVKLCAGCLKQPGATAIDTLGCLLEPGFYLESAAAFLESGDLPVLNLVFFGLYSNDGGQTTSGYTYGLDVFGRRDLEVLDSPHAPAELFELLLDTASYVLNENATLRPGETIGFSEEQRLTITESEGVVLEGTTLKIAF